MIELKFPSNIKNVLESEGVKAAYKALDSLDDSKYKKTKMLCLADVVESVLFIYEKQYPNDLRVRNCINGIRDYCNDKISEEELNKLREDVNNIANYLADNASDVISDDAADVAYAVAYAVYDFDADVYDFAAAVACAVAYCCANDTDAQWQKNEDILKKYL